jgi:D-alanyl-D-alanine dipeptidase
MHWLGALMDIVLLSDPVVTGIPLEDCGEPLVDLREVTALRLDDRLADRDAHYCLLRVGVVDRLVTAQALLAPGVRLLVVEGYRPADLQARYFTEHVADLRRAHPDLDEATLRRTASRYIARPEGAPHVSGAAVDLTLCSVDGGELWMGTELNDTDGPACHMAWPHLDGEAVANRDRLSRAMRGAGLVNYPTEWWHWSYGDRYWAYATKAPAARYGPLARTSLK